MENKKGITILLTIVGLCLVGLGVWFAIKYFNGEESESEDEGSSNSVDLIGERIDFPQKSDDSVLIGEFYELLTESELKTNFKNLKKEKNGKTFIYNCEEYNKNESVCGKIKLTINNEFSYEEQVPYGPCGSDISCFNKTNFYKVNGYYIAFVFGKDGGCDNNSVVIYKDSKEVYRLSLEVKTHYTVKATDESIINLTPVVANSVLHFVTQVDMIDNKYGTLKYVTIDLTKDTIEVKSEKEFRGYFVSCYK